MHRIKAKLKVNFMLICICLVVIIFLLATLLILFRNDKSEEDVEETIPRQNAVVETITDDTIEAIDDPYARYQAYITKANSLTYNGDSSGYDYYLEAYSIEAPELTDEQKDTMLFTVYENAIVLEQDRIVEEIRAALGSEKIDFYSSNVVRVEGQ